MTDESRRTLQMPEPWLDADGTIRHATVFHLADRAPAGRRYVDAMGNAFAPERHTVVGATVTDGTVAQIRA